MSDICKERYRDVNEKDFDGKGIDLSNSTSPSCNSGELPTIQQDTKCNENNVRQKLNIVHNEKDSTKSRPTIDLSTFEISNTSCDLILSEDEPSSILNGTISHKKHGEDMAFSHILVSQAEGISDAPTNHSNSEIPTNENYESSADGHNTNTHNYFLFPSIVLPNNEDISSNCCNLDWDKWAFEYKIDEAPMKLDDPSCLHFQPSTPCTSATNELVSTNRYNAIDKCNKSKSKLEPIKIPSLQAVAIQASDHDSSPTLVRDRNVSPKKKKLGNKKKNKKEPLITVTRSQSLHSTQNDKPKHHTYTGTASSDQASSYCNKIQDIPLLNITSKAVSYNGKTPIDSMAKVLEAPINVQDHAKSSNTGDSMGESLDTPKIKTRRKSIVDILFSKQQPPNEYSTPPETPPIVITKILNNDEIDDSSKPSSSTKLSCDSLLAPTPSSKRLNLRRLSEIVIGKKKTKDVRSCRNSIKDDIGINEGKYGNFLSIKDSGTRRSSISVLDNSKQLVEAKSAFIQEERKRMSSFPPSEHNEKSLILQNIQAASHSDLGPNSLNDDSDIAKKSTDPKISPFRFLSLLSVSKKTAKASKSSLDIPAQIQAANTDSNHHNAVYHAIKPGSSNHKRTELMHLSIPKQQTYAHLSPSIPYPYRRCSSPSLAELDTMKNCEDGFQGDQDTPINKPLRSIDCKRASITSLPHVGSSMECNKSSIVRPGVVVFPNRKVGEVPGIFIPNQNKTKQKGTSFLSAPVPSIPNTSNKNLMPSLQDTTSGNIVNKHLLCVTSKSSERRRHSISMSEPVFVGKLSSAVHSSYSPLLPRSAYLDTSNSIIPFLNGRYERNNLIKTFLKQK